MGKRKSNGLADIRRDRGLLSGFVCRKVGINPTTMWRWETEGKQPTQIGYTALSVFYGVPVSVLKEAAANASSRA